MTGAEIAVRPSRPLSQAEDTALREQVRMIQATDFVPTAYRGKPHEIYACVLTGRSLGLDPMTSLRQIYIVDGKATLSAELMVALVRRAGHSISGSSSATEAVARGKRADNGDEFETSFTIEEARQIPAKERGQSITLAEKHVWKAYPADMLWARAVSRLCRRLFPDVLAGVSYTPDEAELSPEERAGEATDDLPLPPDPEDSLAPVAAADALSDKEPQFEGAAAPPPSSPSEAVRDADPNAPDAMAHGVAQVAPASDGEASWEGEQTALTVPGDVRRRMENGE